MMKQIKIIKFPILHSLCSRCQASSPAEITLLADAEKYLVENNFMVGKINSLNGQSQQDFIKLWGSELSIHFI